MTFFAQLTFWSTPFLCPGQEILMTFFCSTHFLKYPLSRTGDFDDLFFSNSLSEVPVLLVRDQRFLRPFSFFSQFTFWTLSVTRDFDDLFLFSQLTYWTLSVTRDFDDLSLGCVFSKKQVVAPCKKLNDIFSSFLFSLKLTFYSAQKRADCTGGGKMCLRVCASCV